MTVPPYHRRSTTTAGADDDNNNNTITHPIAASPGTRRRRRQPQLPANRSSAGSTTLPQGVGTPVTLLHNSLLDMPTMQHPPFYSSVPVYAKNPEDHHPSSSALPMHHASSDVSGRYKGHRGGSPSKLARSSQRCLRQTCLQPRALVRSLGLIIVGRLVYTHFYLVSLSHQRALWSVHESRHAADRFLDIFFLPRHPASTTTTGTTTIDRHHHSSYQNAGPILMTTTTTLWHSKPRRGQSFSGWDRRRNQTRPPPPPPHMVALPAVANFVDPSPVIATRTHATVKHDDSGSALPSWSALCQQANLNAGSQVLIFNILSHPVGPAVAKLIAKQCRVRHIVGADPMLPNRRQARMAFMALRQDLLYHVAGGGGGGDVKMIVTDPGRGLHEKNRLRPLQWLSLRQPPQGKKHNHAAAVIQPTHVLVLDPIRGTPAWVVDDRDGRSTETQSSSSFALYAMQQLRQVWQDLADTFPHLPLRVLHVGNPSFYDVTSQLGLASVSTWNQSVPFSFSTLSLGPVSGPGMPPHVYDKEEDGDEDIGVTIFVENGLRAILTGWGRPHQFFSVSLPASPLSMEEALATSIWDNHLAHPFGLTPPSANQTAIVETRHRLDELGSPPVRLPCASQCQSTSSLRTCTASVWDHAIGPSTAATKGCQYALIMANFSTHLTEAPLHSVHADMCRVLYISRKSPLAKRYKSKANGQARSNGWNLVWLDTTDKSYSANDSAFLRIDPSRLLSTSVQKVMHVNTLAFGAAPDEGLLTILQNIDRRAFREGERRILITRKGTELKHWKSLPAEKGRRVVLFVGNPLPENQPSKVTEYRAITGRPASPQQIEFYTQLGHWTHVILDRPQDEIQSTRYLSFPFEWTSPYFLVHDLVSDTARQLRCRWLQEHLTWNRKPAYWETDDLSLAAVLGSMKILNEIGLPTDEAEPGWLPFWDNTNDERLLEGNKEVFVRLMQPLDN